MEDITKERLKPIIESMLADLRKAEVFPEDEYPTIPELSRFKVPFIQSALGSVQTMAKTKGLGTEDVEALFTFIFLRATDLAWQWHQTDDGNVNINITLGPPSNDESFLTLTSDMIQDVKDSQAIKIVFCAFMDAWYPHHETLQSAGVDIWPALTLGLGIAYDAAISLFLKIFDYRK